eukprot:gene8520-9393_t
MTTKRSTVAKVSVHEEKVCPSFPHTNSLFSSAQLHAPVPFHGSGSGSGSQLSASCKEGFSADEGPASCREDSLRENDMQLIVEHFHRLGEYSAEPDSAAWRQYRDMVYQINRKHKAMDEAAFLRLRESVATPVAAAVAEEEDDVSRCSDHSVVALPPILRLRLSAKHHRPPPSAPTPGGGSSSSGSGSVVVVVTQCILPPLCTSLQ